MKLAILEENHFEVLDVYLKIFNAVLGKHPVYVVTNKQILNLLSTKVAQHNLLLTDGIFRNNELRSEIIDFLEKNKVDILLYNTVEMGEYSFANKLVQQVGKKLGTKVILTLHNINTFFKPSLFIAKHPIRFLENAMTIVRKRKLIKSVSALNVLCENQKNYLVQKIGCKKPVFYIPPCIAESNGLTQLTENKTVNVDLLTITIFGGVDKNRKDFKTVIDAFKQLGKYCKYFDVQIIGSAKGIYAKKINESFELLAKEYSMTYSFPEEGQPILSNDQVAALLDKTDFLLCPTVPVAIYEGNKEYYGISKSTGNFYDIIRYKKPAIFPIDIPVPLSLKSCVLSYSNPISLADLLKNLLTDIELRNNLVKAVKEAESNYSLPKIVFSVQEQFTQILAS